MNTALVLEGRAQLSLDVCGATAGQAAVQQRTHRKATRPGWERASAPHSRCIVAVQAGYSQSFPTQLDGLQQVVEPLQPQLPVQRPQPLSAQRPQQGLNANKPALVSEPRIMNRITATTSWQELQNVVVEYQHSLNFRHISAAVVQFTRLQTQKAVAADLDTQLEDQQPISSQLGSGGQQQHRDLQPPITPSSSQLLQPRAAYDFLRWLLNTTLQLVESYDVRGVSNTLHSLAVLRHHDASLVERLLAAVQYRMDGSTPQNLSNMIWSCVTLGVSPGSEWMAQFYAAIDCQISLFRPQDLSNTLWAFGRLEFNGSQYKVSSVIVGKLLQQSYPQLHKFQPQHLANSAWGLARLRFTPSLAWIEAFLSASMHRMSAMKPAELCSTVWAVSRFKAKPPKQWLDNAMEVLRPNLEHLNDEQLSLVLVSLGSMRAEPDALWIQAVMQRSIQLAPETAQHPLALVNTLAGIAMLKGHDIQGLSTEVAAQWQSVHVGLFTDMLADIQIVDKPRQPMQLNGHSHEESFGEAGLLVTRSQETNSQSNAQGSSSATGITQINGSWDASQGNGSPAADISSMQLSVLQQAEQPPLNIPVQIRKPCQLKAEELAYTLYALAQMRVKLSPEVLQRVFMTLERSPGLLHSAVDSGKMLAIILQSLLYLMNITSQAETGQCEGFQRDMSQNNTGSNTIAEQPIQDSQPPLPAVSSDQTSRKVQLPVSLLLLIGRLSAKRLRKMTAYEISVILTTFAWHSQQPTSAWFSRYWWSTLVSLGKMQIPAQTLVCHLQLLQRLGHRPHDTWWKGVAKNCIYMFPSFNSSQLSRLILQMAQLGHKPHNLWTNRFLLATYRLWDEFKPGEWQALLWGLAKVQARVPSPWSRRFYSSTLDKLDSFSPVQLAYTVWAVSKLHINNRPASAWTDKTQTLSLPHLSVLSQSQLLHLVTGISHIAKAPRRQWLQGAVAAARLHAGHWQPEQEQAMAIALQRLKVKLQRSLAKEQDSNRAGLRSQKLRVDVQSSVRLRSQRHKQVPNGKTQVQLSTETEVIPPAVNAQEQLVEISEDAVDAVTNTNSNNGHGSVAKELVSSGSRSNSNGNGKAPTVSDWNTSES